MKYLKFVRETFNDSKFPIFKISDLKTSLGLKGIREGYLKRMLNYLSKRGEIKRVTRGIYTFHDDSMVVGFAFKPFYYGLEHALTIRNIWDQSTNPSLVTWRNVRTGVRKFDGGTYSINRIEKTLFFGYDTIRYYDFWIPVSENEKTLIDLVYFKHSLPKDVAAVFKKSINRSKLNNYLKFYSLEVKNGVKAILK